MASAAKPRTGYPDPGALQRQVDQIVDAPPIVRANGVRTDVGLAGPYGGTSDSSPDQRVCCGSSTDVGHEFDCPEMLRAAGVRAPARRGTTNGNARGSVIDRERRRAWLVATYRADKDVLVVRTGNGTEIRLDTLFGHGQPACRCYRCGRLLTIDTVTVDRIIPGCRGGTYRRENIRPACGPCNSETGGKVRRKR